MKTKFYIKEKIIAGVTLRDETELENNNMALHACVDSNNVITNRKKLASLLHCSLDDFVCSNQTHSANFYRVTTEDKGRGSERLDTAINNNDALYTYEPNLLLCCFTADCVPVIFYNNVTGVIGVIHSGWKGTINEITPNVLNHLICNENCDPADLNILIGMSLSQKRFEVDKDVYLHFRELGYADDSIYYDEKTCKYHINNQRVVKKQCELNGIRPNQIILDTTCTYDSHDGFSYRKDKKCGRHLNFIIKKEE